MTGGQMLNIKQIKSLRNEYECGRVGYVPVHLPLSQIFDTLAAALRVVGAAKECVGELGQNHSMEELEKALKPFAEGE